VSRQGTTRRERAVGVAFAFAAWLSGLAVLGILVFLAWFCLPLLEDGANVWSWDWQPFQGRFGILPMVVGSLLLASLALAVAFPLAVGICAFVHALGPPRLARLVLAAIRLMTGVPTIVYAFASAILLVPLVRGAFAHGSGYSLLTATLVLSILVLPTLVLLIHAHWQSRVEDLRLTCASLGLTRAQAVLHVWIPVSKRALVLAGILGFARAIGDTMIALLLSGNAAQVPESPLASMRALTAHIALVHATDSQDTAYASIFAAGLILLLTTGTLSIAVRALQGRDGNGGSRARAR
jgi:phosphate transport system permease protein